MRRKIVRGEPFEDEPEEIIITLDNGNVIMLTLKHKRNEPLFDEVVTEHLTPQTDGGRVYWQNGASLTLEDIIEMVRAETGEDDTKC
jgi:hypothetical protein